MGIFNYMLNQRPANQRAQEEHEAKMREIAAREAANKKLASMGFDELSAYMGANGPALSPGAIAGAGQPPPPGPGEAQPMPAQPSLLNHLLPGEHDPLTKGQAAPAPSSANPSAMSPANSAQTSLNSSYQDDNDGFMIRDLYAKKLIMSGDPLLIREGMEILTTASQDIEQSGQFDQTADIQRGQLDINRGRLALDNEQFDYKTDVFDPRTFGQVDRGLDIDEMNANTSRINANKANDPSNNVGTYNPRDYTAESWSDFAASGFTDPSGLRRYESPYAIVEKRRIENLDKITDVNSRMRGALSLAEQASNFTGVMTSGTAATVSEFVKNVTGSQDEVSVFRVRVNELRNDAVLANLPPGVASDKDVELAMKGFINDRYNAEQMQSFFTGVAKLEAMRSAYIQAEQRWLDTNGRSSGFIDFWDENGASLVDAKFRQVGLINDPQITAPTGDSPDGPQPGAYQSRQQELQERYGLPDGSNLGGPY